MRQADTEPIDPELRDALRVLAHEQRDLAAPAAVEDRVMRAWDDAHATPSPRRRRFATHVLATAAAGVIAVSIGYWWTSRAGEPSGLPATGPAVAAPTGPSYDALAWVDADPASLQIVRIRVASTALAEHGYAVSDPDGDGLVDVEMVVGTDGIAQSVRLSPATSWVEYE